MGTKYDKNKESVFIQYLDANNLYGWATSKYLPYGGFQWASLENFNSDSNLEMKEDQQKGYYFEVDLGYPKELRDKHSDYPYYPENIIDNEELPKLFTTL